MPHTVNQRESKSTLHSGSPGGRAATAMLSLIVFLASMVLGTTSASALPSFAIQTDQPCSACHIGAYGPRLTQAGRDFKLYGYVANDTKEHTLPFTLMAESSFTHTTTDQIAAALAGYEPNNNVTLDAIALFYAGKLFDSVGAFVEFTYDVVEKSLHWEDLDIRYAREVKLFGKDAVIGASLNNSPSIGDLWDSKPSWSFPFVESPFTLAPAQAPIIDRLPFTVLGAGAFAMWDDAVYLEADLYGGLSHGVLRALGTAPLNDVDRQDGPAIYWRATWQRELDEGEHYFAVGTYGLQVNVFPLGISTAGSDDYTDIAFDATYQWNSHPELSTSDKLSAHILYLREDSDLSASSIVVGTQPTASLSTVRLELAYSIDATYTPTVQYFQTTGSTDAVHWNTSSGDPGSAGWIIELDYVPWGKPDAPWAWLNGRAALMYIHYSKFDGSSIGASDNDTLLLNFNIALAANR